MIALASFAVTLALGCVGYAVFAAIIGLLRRCPRWTSSAMRAIMRLGLSPKLQA